MNEKKLQRLDKDWQIKGEKKGTSKEQPSLQLLHDDRDYAAEILTGAQALEFAGGHGKDRRGSAVFVGQTVGREGGKRVCLV
jgi:hypothetical protein